jgi:hypothetical protein
MAPSNDTSRAQVPMVGRAGIRQRGRHEAGCERANDAHDATEQQALLRIRPHDATGYPANDRPSDDPSTPLPGHPPRPG